MGVVITILLLGFIVLAIGSRDKIITVVQPHQEPGVVLIIKIHEVDGSLKCSISGPGTINHAMFAAAALSATVIQEIDQGVEGGLQVMQEQTLLLLKE